MMQRPEGRARDIPRRHRMGPVPASFAQQRLWFLDRLEPGNPAYNCPIPLRLLGRLNIEALTASLADIVSRHEVLRTTYHMECGQLVQVICPELGVPCPITDLSSVGREAREAMLQQAITEEGKRPFDLLRGPVFRAQLLRLGPYEHVLLYDVHHIAFDAWSVGVFYAELATCYNARVLRKAARLPELPIQYADYACWQRARVCGSFLDKQLAFWRTQLDGLGSLEVPTDRPRSSSLSYQGGFRHLTVASALVDQLRALGRSERASLFMTLLTALNVLLSRYTRQDDIAVGTAATDRTQPSLQALIGFFPNTIVLRTDLSGEPTFRELLRRVVTMALSAYGHAELPFDLLVQELHPPRHTTRTPMFPVYFTLDETPEALPALDGLTVESIVPDFLTAKFDLGFNVHVTENEVSLHCVYSADLFEIDTVDRMLGHFRTLLEAAAADPDRPVTRLPMLSTAEQDRILVEWNDTKCAFPSRTCLHQLFEANVARCAEATAVISGDRTLTYRALELQANRLAHRLRAMGVGPETIVGVCLPRSPEMVVAILAVLKAGGAYLPLDSEYPAERLTFMMRDADVRTIVTEEALREQLGGGPARLLCMDSGDLAAEPVRPPDSLVTAANLAYVIYTSGSAGTPKGIALRHRGAVNNFCDLNTRFSIGPGDSVLAVSSPSFDMSVYDILGMLGAGGTIVLPEPGASRDPARWARLLREHEVTVWHSAPALLELLLEHEQYERSGELPRLRLALLGGDWIPVSQPDRLRDVAPNVCVIGLGGATEASMDSIVFPIEWVDPAWASIPYGRPMANQRAYVLDHQLQPVPVGVFGELHLAGAGLARGYLNRPTLTAVRFVDHTFPTGRRERLYKTGDLARYRPDGVIELVGRMDHQIKVHGLRVELGEVEAVLRRHKAVKDATVVARGDRGRAWLAGFYVPRAVGAIPEAELRRWMGQTLPSYMIPSAFMALERLPTTANGKVDRRALVTWEITRASGQQGPCDAVEDRVAAVWRDVLDIAELGIDDDFFELGGDSFSAIRAVLAIDSSLPVIELFKNPTVRTLAAWLRSTQKDANHRKPSRLLHELTRSGPAPEASLVCVPYGGGNAVAYQPLADRLPFGLSLWSVGLPGHDPSGRDDDFISVEEAALRCADEILARITGPVMVYGQCAGVALAVELARVLEDRGSDVRDVYVGAGLPDPDPEDSLRREPLTSDDLVYDVLRSIGGFDGPLEWDEVSLILRAVRSDLVESSKFFLAGRTRPPRKLRATLHCVFGDLDPMIPDYAVRYRDWGRYAGSLRLHVIRGGGHYFVRDQAHELAALIACACPRTGAGPGRPGVPLSDGASVDAEPAEVRASWAGRT